MEITIHIPSIDRLANSIEALARAKNPSCYDCEPACNAQIPGQIEFPIQNTETPPLVNVHENMAASPLYVSAPAPAPAPAPLPTQAITYTMQDLAVAGTVLVDAGRGGEVVNLLKQFGVTSLPALDQKHYGAFATALRGMGAPI